MSVEGASESAEMAWSDAAKVKVMLHGKAEDHVCGSIFAQVKNRANVYSTIDQRCTGQPQTMQGSIDTRQDKGLL